MKKAMSLLITLLLTVFMCLAFTSCGASPDFKTDEELEAALNAGEDCEGKIVVLSVDKFIPDGTLGYTIWSGEHLNFISSKNPKVKEGDEFKVKITEVRSMLKSWFIYYEPV